MPPPSSASPAGPAARIAGWLPRVALALLAASLLRDLAMLLHLAWVAVRDPFGLEYGEGIVWQQMLNIVAGHGYGPLGTFPAIVYHYPPLYHLTVAAIAGVAGSDGLATGRAVSFAATIGTAAILGMLAARLVRSLDRPAPGASGWLAALIYLSCWPVVGWAAVMRVDMLASLFGMAGMLLAVKAIERPRLIHGAALCFVAAVYVKQMSIAAPAAAFVGLAVVRPRLAAICLAECVLLGLAALAMLEATTHGGFLQHVVVYNINRAEPARLLLLGPLASIHGTYVILASIGLWLAGRRLREAWPDRGGQPLLVATLVTLGGFFLLRTLLLATIIKSGGVDNYTIEWFGAVAMFAAMTVATALDAAMRRPDGSQDRRPLLAVVLLIALAAQAWMIPHRANSLIRDARVGERGLPTIVAMIRATTKPVISDNMTLPIRAGGAVLWEPAITAELGSIGRYDEAGFAALVRARRFGFFATQGRHGVWLFDSRYNPPVAQAMAAAYPVRREVGGLSLHLPPPGIDPALDRLVARLPR